MTWWGDTFSGIPPEKERRKPMSKRMLNMSVAAVLAAGFAAASSNVASAMPFADALAIRNATGTDVEKVWGRGFGWGFGAGFLGGAIVGGALAAPYYYGGPYYYYGAPYYPPAAYGPGYYPAPGYGGDAAYCASRYRSYDPATGTFLGYDGMRHPCP
jgi:hypothetical protein